MAKLRFKVMHNGQPLAKGSECPVELAEKFGKLGYLEDAPKAELQAPSASAPIPVGEPGAVQGAPEIAPSDLGAQSAPVGASGSEKPSPAPSKAAPQAGKKAG